jgi:hypothetical protein
MLLIAPLTNRSDRIKTNIIYASANTENNIIFELILESVHSL